MSVSRYISLPKVAISNYCKLGSKNKRNLLSPSSTDQKSEIQVGQGC